MAVSKRAFEGRLRRLHQAHPSLSEFQHEGMTLTRQCEDLRQVIEFQPGTGSKKDRFTFNAGWKLQLDEYTRAGFLCWQRPQFFVGGGDIWYSRANAARLDQSLGHVAPTLVNFVVPFLDGHRSVEALVARVESGDTPVAVAFGVEPVMQHYAYGLCLERLGRAEEGLAEVQKAVEIADERALAHGPPAYFAMVEHARALLSDG